MFADMKMNFLLDNISEEGLDFVNPINRNDVCQVIAKLSLESNASVLDVGCGNGLFLRMMDKHFGLRAGLGIDHRNSVIAKARVAAERDFQDGHLTFRVGDVNSSLCAGSYDLVIMLGSVHAIGGISEVRRFLHAKGITTRFIIIGERSATSVNIPEHILQLLERRNEKTYLRIDQHFDYFNNEFKKCDLLYQARNVDICNFEMQLIKNLQDLPQDRYFHLERIDIDNRIAEYKKNIQVYYPYFTWCVWLVQCGDF